MLRDAIPRSPEYRLCMKLFMRMVFLLRVNFFYSNRKKKKYGKDDLVELHAFGILLVCMLRLYDILFSQIDIVVLLTLFTEDMSILFFLIPTEDYAQVLNQHVKLISLLNDRHKSFDKVPPQ